MQNNWVKLEDRNNFFFLIFAVFLAILQKNTIFYNEGWWTNFAKETILLKLKQGRDQFIVTEI